MLFKGYDSIIYKKSLYILYYIVLQFHDMLWHNEPFSLCSQAFTLQMSTVGGENFFMVKK